MEIARSENEILKREVKDLEKALEERQKKALCNILRYKYHMLFICMPLRCILIIFHIYVTLNNVIIIIIYL